MNVTFQFLYRLGAAIYARWTYSQQQLEKINAEWEHFADELKDQVQELKAENKSQRDTITDLQGRIADLERDCRQCEDERRRDGDRIAALEKEVESLRGLFRQRLQAFTTEPLRQ